MFNVLRCAKCQTTWKGEEPLPLACPNCGGHPDDHEHQFPEVIIEGERVLRPCLLCGLAALDGLQLLRAEHY